MDGELNNTKQPGNREDSGRNPDGTFQKGVSGNPNGRPKDTLKDYLRRKFSEMTEEEKEEFLKNIPYELQWQMAEGRPSQEQQTDITSNGESINQILDACEQNTNRPETDG